MQLEQKSISQPRKRMESHPTVATFVKVGAILFIITAIEWSIAYVQGMRATIVTILFALSALKFALVAAVFMHLKFDNKYLTRIFAAGVVLAVGMVIALTFINRA